MTRRRTRDETRRRWGTARTLLASCLVGALAAAQPVAAAPITITQVGTFSTDPGTGNVNAGFSRGNKFVVQTTYDAAVTPAAIRSIDGLDFRVIDLSAGGNSFDLLVPMEGQGTVYTQNETNHLHFPGFNNPTPQIIFTQANAGTNNLPPVTDPGLNTPGAPDFVGYEFEGDFTNSDPAGPTNGNFAELRVKVVPIDVGGGVIQRTATFNTEMAHCSDATCADFDIAVRSVDRNPDQPTIGLAQAVVAEGGADVAYSAAALSQTTDASSQNNNLGNARTDKEDFVSYAWTDGGGALVGADADGAEDNVIPVIGDPTVVDPPGPHPQRAVENVNKTVAIENSGLTTTTDSVQWQVEVNEDLTGLGGSTDTVNVTYTNAGPTAEAGGDLVFDASNFMGPVSTSGASASDADLAVNAVIGGFETIDTDFRIDGVGLPGNPAGPTSPATVVNPLSESVTLAQSGITMTTGTNTLDLTVTDGAGASHADSANIRYQNALPVIANASATALGPGNADLLFDLSNTDADLAVNNVFAGFEALTVQILIDGADETGFFTSLIGDGTGGTQLVTNDQLMNDLGLGVGAHQFKVNVSDKFILANAAIPVMQIFNFDVVDAPLRQAPEPTSVILLGMGLAALGLGARRRRRPAT